MATFFATADEFVTWLEKHGADETEFVVGYYAYSHRREHKSRIYSYEQKKTAALERAEKLRFRKAKAAWKFFAAQPDGYRQRVIWRIVSAKRSETRERRLTALIEASAEQRRL